MLGRTASLLACMLMVGVAPAAAAMDGVSAGAQLAPGLYPGAACLGRVQLTVEAPWAANTGGLAVIGDPDCKMTLSNDMAPATTCTIYLHEFGHLTGLDHSPDPASIMFGGPLPDWPACAALTDPPAPVVRRPRRVRRAGWGCARRWPGWGTGRHCRLHAR